MLLYEDPLGRFQLVHLTVYRPDSSIDVNAVALWVRLRPFAELLPKVKSAPKTKKQGEATKAKPKGSAAKPVPGFVPWPAGHLNQLLSKVALLLPLHGLQSIDRVYVGESLDHGYAHLPICGEAEGRLQWLNHPVPVSEGSAWDWRSTRNDSPYASVTVNLEKFFPKRKLYWAVSSADANDLPREVEDEFDTEIKEFESLHAKAVGVLAANANGDSRGWGCRLNVLAEDLSVFGVHAKARFMGENVSFLGQVVEDVYVVWPEPGSWPKHNGLIFPGPLSVYAWAGPDVSSPHTRKLGEDFPRKAGRPQAIAFGTFPGLQVEGLEAIELHGTFARVKIEHTKNVSLGLSGFIGFLDSDSHGDLMTVTVTENVKSVADHFGVSSMDRHNNELVRFAQPDYPAAIGSVDLESNTVVDCEVRFLGDENVLKLNNAMVKAYHLKAFPAFEGFGLVSDANGLYHGDDPIALIHKGHLTFGDKQLEVLRELVPAWAKEMLYSFTESYRRKSLKVPDLDAIALEQLTTALE